MQEEEGKEVRKGEEFNTVPLLLHLLHCLPVDGVMLFSGAVPMDSTYHLQYQSLPVNYHKSILLVNSPPLLLLLLNSVSAWLVRLIAPVFTPP